VLHVTNGDCAAGGLRQAGLPGTVVISADVLHEGPAPAVGEDEWHRIRADYLASRGDGTADGIRSEGAQWDANVDAGAREDEVVLRDILSILMRGPRSPRELFPAQQVFEDRVFMGDSSFAWILHGLAASTPALISMKGEASTDSLSAGAASITPFGRQVIGGETDRVAAGGIDRWLGGVHLSGRGPLWRWDATTRRLTNR
jgi:hypothetical protein